MKQIISVPLKSSVNKAKSFISDQPREKIHSLDIGLFAPFRIKKWAERKVKVPRSLVQEYKNTSLLNGGRVHFRERKLEQYVYIIPEKRKKPVLAVNENLMVYKFGKIINSKTLHYKTLQPELGGLFCQRIFGPLQDFTCLCEQKKKNNFYYDQTICSVCYVEFLPSRIRRYRLGYIALAVPIPHIWYLKSRPSYLNILFDQVKHIEPPKLFDISNIVYGIDAMFIWFIHWSKKENLKKNLVIPYGI